MKIIDRITGMISYIMEWINNHTILAVLIIFFGSGIFKLLKLIIMGILDGYKTYDTSGGYGNSKQWRRTFKDRMSTEDAEAVMQANDKETPYTILGIDEGAAFEAIKKAYRAKMMEWHPDRNSHRVDEATMMAKKINAAFTILENQLK